MITPGRNVYGPKRASVIDNKVIGGTTGSVLYVDDNGNLGQDNSNFFFKDSGAGGKALGIGTNAPGTVDVDGLAVLLAGNGTHVQSTGNAYSVIEGDVAFSYMIDTGGASDDKIMRYGVADGVAKFSSLDDTTSSRIDNILVMDMGTGNVGIGTTVTDFSKLEVVGSTEAGEERVFQIRNNFTTANTATTLRLANSTSPNSTYGSCDIVSTRTNSPGGGDTNLLIKTSTGATMTDVMTMLYNGNVGIGTTAPSSRFSVSGGSLATTSSGRELNIASGLTTGRLGTFDNDSLSSIHKYFDASSVEISAGSTGSQVTGISMTGGDATLFDGVMRFFAHGSERMRIDKDGNVGIGTTAPGYKLQIEATSGDAVLALRRSDSASPTGWIYGLGTSGGSATYGSAVQLYLGETRFLQDSSPTDTSNNLTQAMVIDKDGNVGIGTTSPDTKLQVVGDTKFGDDNTNYASFASDGELTLTGTARVNKEFSLLLTDFNPGASGPTKALNDIYPTFEFTIDDDMHTSFEMPTDWAVGTDLTVEVYWAIDEAYATNSGEVRWSADWRAVVVGEVISAGASGTMDFGDVNIHATANTVVKTEATVSGASLASDDLVAFNGARVDLVAGSNPTAEPYIIAVRVEYIADKLGEAT